MERAALENLKRWWKEEGSERKPLIIQGARQVGKSFLVRDFCARQKLICLEMNFEKEPSLRRLFVEGHNSKTTVILEAHFGVPLNQRTLLFLDEIQSAPEVFARLRYFYEDTPQVAVIAAGSLLEFALAELQYSVPVGRIEYLHLNPMRFEEFLKAQKEEVLLGFLKLWRQNDPKTFIPEALHDRLLAYARDFSLVGGMPEAVRVFGASRDFLECQSVQRSILETYRNDFSKYRKRIPLERIDRVFSSIPAQIGKKWVYARISQHEKAHALEQALDALCKARVAHQVFHSSGNGVPLGAEKKDNLFKVLFLDVGLLGVQLGLRIADMTEADSFSRVNEGAVAEQWIGQHLLDFRISSQSPELFYWVREKVGSMAEVDYLVQLGPHVIPVEVKAGHSSRVKSLQVFQSEKKSLISVHFSSNPAKFHRERRVMELPFYLIDQLSRILSDQTLGNSFL